MILNKLFIVCSLSSRNSQNLHSHCFVSRTKSCATKIGMRYNIVENSRGKPLLERSGTCSETVSSALDILSELSRLLCSPLETCLNVFQNSIPFLSERNKTNESVEML